MEQIILTLNVGSSSVKYSLWKKHRCATKGLIERIGLKGSVQTHEQAIRIILDELIQKKWIRHQKDIAVVGHRIVQGGKYPSSASITPTVMKELEKWCPDFPLHQPHELKAVRICKKLMSAPQIAVFDTSFFHALPEKAKVYGLPYKFYQKGIRRYGFHGISHQYVYQEACRLLKKKGNVITCHLGNGCSITATQKGNPIDTSLGFTPLEGLMMGSRCGDLDPGIIPHLMRTYKLSLKQIEDLLSKQSGFKGIAGCRDVRDVLQRKDKRAKLAVDIFCYRAAKYIASYMMALQKTDAIVFTAGIGENSAIIREKILSYFNYQGIMIDKAKNNKSAKMISHQRSNMPVFVIPTNEELLIAEECMRLAK